MSRRRRIAVIETGRREHPAATAWSALQARDINPASITVLKDSQHSSVFRLDGAGPAGSSVIAKRSTLASLLTEQTVYEQALSRLPLRPLRCYGLLRGEDSVYGWLFLEDAGNDCYSADLFEHRALVAKWLGRTHSSAVELAHQCKLPDRGPLFFRNLLQAGSGRIRQSLDKPSLRAGDPDLLKTVVSQLQILFDRWDEVEEYCERVPKTLVHGDLKSKNLRIRAFAPGPELFALDWEVAGWATPAVDLHFVEELELYLDAVRDVWPHLSLVDLRQLRFCGRLFRLVASIYWATAGLEHDWLERTMRHVELYSSRLNELIRTAGWEA